MEHRPRKNFSMEHKGKDRASANFCNYCLLIQRFFEGGESARNAAGFEGFIESKAKVGDQRKVFGNYLIAVNFAANDPHKGQRHPDPRTSRAHDCDRITEERRVGKEEVSKCESWWGR